MTIPTFSPLKNPDQAMDVTAKPNILSTQYNDGYEQTGTYGINTNLKPISPAWTNAYNNEAQYIMAFLDARITEGLTPFYYQPNGQGAILCFKCKTYTAKEKKGKYWDITADFTPAGKQ